MEGTWEEHVHKNRYVKTAAEENAHRGYLDRYEVRGWPLSGPDGPVRGDIWTGTMGEAAFAELAVCAGDIGTGTM